MESYHLLHRQGMYKLIECWFLASVVRFLFNLTWPEAVSVNVSCLESCWCVRGLGGEDKDYFD